MASVLIATASVSYELERVSDVPLDMCSAQAHVRFGSKADMCSAKGHVRFTPESGHYSALVHACFGPKADLSPFILITSSVG